MKKFPFHSRQGDVLVIAVKELPDGVAPVERESGRIILAHGELTGHAHAIAAPNVKQYKSLEGRMYFEVDGDAPAPLRHEEHTEHVFPPGFFRSVRQSEYAPEALRNVAD